MTTVCARRRTLVRKGIVQERQLLVRSRNRIVTQSKDVNAPPVKNRAAMFVRHPRSVNVRRILIAMTEIFATVAKLVWLDSAEPVRRSNATMATRARTMAVFPKLAAYSKTTRLLAMTAWGAPSAINVRMAPASQENNVSVPTG